MRATTFTFGLDPGSSIRCYITPPKGYCVGFVQVQTFYPTGTAGVLLSTYVTVTPKKGYESQFSDAYLKPIFADINKRVETTIYSEATFPQSYTYTVIFLDEDEAKDILKEEPGFRWVQTKVFGQQVWPGDTILLWKNDKNHPVFVGNLMMSEEFQNFAIYEIKRGPEVVAEIARLKDDWSEEKSLYRLGYWLEPKQTLTAKYIQTDGYVSNTFKWWLFIADKEIYLPEVFRPVLTKIYGPILPEKPNIAIIPEVIQEGVKTLPLPNKITPYPNIQPGGINPTVTYPQEKQVTKTKLYISKKNPIPTSIATKDETMFVEAMMSPYGAVRKTADAMGRVRKTDAAITYEAGKLDVTDANAHTIFKGYHTKTVSLYAKAEKWEIKILPICDWLKGRSIADMDTIYLDEGEQIEIDIEAREIQATCPTGSATVTGTLYWEVEK